MANPKLRFSNNYADWHTLSLKDFCSLVKRKNTDNSCQIPLTISSTFGLVNQLEYFSKKIASQDMSNYYLLKKGEFAYNKSYSNGFDYGSIKRLNLFEYGALSSLYICFSIAEQNSDYMQFYFDSLKWYKSLSKHCGEGARNHGLLNIAKNDFFHTEINIAKSKEEQQKIAEFFTALDEKIRIQLNTVDKLNAIKTGMLAKVFSYENTLDWTVRKFDEIFSLNRTFPVSRDQISDECDKTADNSKIIHYGDILTIYGNIVNPKSDSIGYLVTDVNAKDDDYLCDGDIVFADAAEDYTVGKAIELYGVNCKLLSGLHTIAARPKVTFASGYLSYFFNSPLFKSQVRTLATGTKVMSLTKSSIQTTSISFPSIEEQKKISNLLNTLDNKIAICNKKLEALKQLKKAFMQRMFV